MMTLDRIEALAMDALHAAGIDVSSMSWTEVGLEAWAPVEMWEARVGQEPRKLPVEDHHLSALLRQVDDGEALTVPMLPILNMKEIVLHRSTFHMTDEIDITEPAPFSYDRSGRWKAHPPSKRKRMRSWLRASPSERLRYAPLRGCGEIPAWLRHPDERRRVTICRIVYHQEIGVFADPALSARRLANRLLMFRSNAVRAALRTVRP